jgi:hypothetical protein
MSDLDFYNVIAHPKNGLRMDMISALMALYNRVSKLEEAWNLRTLPDMSADIERLRCDVELMPACEYRRIVHESIDRIEQALKENR